MRAHILNFISMGSLLVLTSCTGAALTPEGLGLNKSADKGASSAGLREVSSSAPSAPSNVPQTYQSSGRLTFENGIRSALNWYPTIDEAVANLGRSAFEIEATKTGYLPKVTGGINSGSIVSSSDERWRPTAQIRATQMLYDFGKLESEIASRNAKAVVSRADLLIAIDGVISDAGNALNEVQRYSELLRVAKDQATGVSDIAQLVMTRTEKGASTLSDEVQAKARVAAAEATVIDISGELTRWKSRLANLIGAEKLPALGGEMPAWMNKACDDGDPDWFSISTVIKAEAMKDEAVSQLELSKRKKYPTINLEGQVNHDILDRGNSGNQMDYKLGLNVDTSLFDGGLAKTNDKVAQAALVGASAASRARRVEAANTISQARMQNASLQTSIANKVARGDLMRQTRDLYQEQYLELGTRTLLDLLNSVQELHSVNFDIVNARFDIRKHNLMCAISSGKIRKYLSLDGTTIRGVRL